MTGTVPYSECRQDMGITQALPPKKPPARPKELTDANKQADRMWALLLDCWDHNAMARPRASTVLASVSL